MVTLRMFAGYHFDSSDHLPRPRPALTPLFATLRDSTSCKSFTCHSYENTGGVYELFPFRNSCLTIRAHRSFRINTCKSVSKQTTLTPFRMNNYEKHRGAGVLLLTTHPMEDGYPERAQRVEGPLFAPDEAVCLGAFFSSQTMDHRSQVCTASPDPVGSLSGTRSGASRGSGPGGNPPVSPLKLR